VAAAAAVFRCGRLNWIRFSHCERSRNSAVTGSCPAAFSPSRATISTTYLIVLIPAPSRIRLVVLGIVLFAGISSWEHILGDLPFGSFTVPLSVEIGGLQGSDRGRIQVSYQPPYRLKDPGNLPRDSESIAIPREGFSWFIPFSPVEELHITAPSEVLHRIQSVTLDIGGKRKSFDKAQFAAAWQPIPVFHEALDQQIGSEATLAWPAHGEPGEIINLRTHRDVLINTAARALAIVAICWFACLVLIAVMRRRGGASTIGEHLPHNESATLWLAIGFAVFCAGIAIARSRQPYAFTQDDNFCQFLPVIVRSAQDFFHGRFPVWNPHQLLGAPTATVGTYMLTYPPTYLSYWIAQRGFGDPYLTIEIFITLHLAVGYFVTFQVVRRFGLRPSLAVAGALSFTLCAFLLIGGRSQCTIVPLAVWLPLLASSILALERGPVGWKWALTTGAVVGVYYHAGHAQFWVYSVMFFAAAVALLLAGGRIAWSRALWCIPALSFGVALAAPLLFPQMAELRGRHFGSNGTGVSLLGMLVPLGRWAQDIRRPFSEPEWSGQMPYFGTTFAVASFLGLGYYFYLLVLCRLKLPEARARIGDATWLLLMLFATVLSLGPDGVLWSLMAYVPPFNDFGWPDKLLPFIAFFSCVGGGMQLERWCSQWRPGRVRCLAVATMGLVLLNTYWARASWYTFADRPYPALEASYASLIAPQGAGLAGRILTRVKWDSRSPAEGFFRTQALNFPTITGALAVGGYDTFVESSSPNQRMSKLFKSDPVAAARAYGVRWLIWDKIFSRPVFSPNPARNEIEMLSMPERKVLLAVKNEAVAALAADGVEVYRVSDTDPLAFVEGPGKAPLRLHFDMRGTTVEVAGISPNASVIVNMLRRPWTRAFADGRPIECHDDAWGRVVVQMKGPARVLEVLYRPPWMRSSLAGLAIAIVGGLCGLFLRLREKRCPILQATGT
jgi:hypothetical protein